MPQEMTPYDRARKNEQAILNALAGIGQNEMAKAMAVAESTVSNMKESAIGRVSALMAHCGLKVVPVGMKCFNPEYVEALQTLAAIGVKNQAPRLDWEETA